MRQPRVYDYMNSGRERCRKKSMLNKSKVGDSKICELLNDGLSMNEIIEAALQAGGSPTATWKTLRNTVYELKAKGGI